MLWGCAGLPGPAGQGGSLERGRTSSCASLLFQRTRSCFSNEGAEGPGHNFNVRDLRKLYQLARQQLDVTQALVKATWAGRSAACWRLGARVPGSCCAGTCWRVLQNLICGRRQSLGFDSTLVHGQQVCRKAASIKKKKGQWFHLALSRFHCAPPLWPGSSTGRVFEKKK